MIGWSYYRSGPDRWWRLFGYQLGFHANGRRRLFSERNGHRKPTPTLRVGRRAEISFAKLRSSRRQSAEAEQGSDFETNSYSVIGEAATLVDEIAVWNPRAIITGGSVEPEQLADGLTDE